MIKKFNIYFLSTFVFVLLASCGSIKEGFSSKKKNNSDEFLVEKKSPLLMPPDYNELPAPESQSILENDEDGIKELITKSKNGNANQDRSADSTSSIEETILGKIKNN
ncbi:DUF3035 domain-containing protein [Candidatus Pelagibacter sp.]|nr:DUF3035 domain-containing protein [Candidatus Pelagibacter sp.]|tara:strand:+ start:243 stop:566 length:324 start_codon:yes stop_codon:yes gene_type:complete